MAVPQSHFAGNARRRPMGITRKISVALINNLPRQKLPSKKEFPN
jgi:hypothetical protein